jgi:hypothetical protein
VKRWPWEHKLPVALMLLLMVCHGPFLPGAHCSRRLLTGGSTVAPGVVVVMARQPEKLSLHRLGVTVAVIFARVSLGRGKEAPRETK